MGGETEHMSNMYLNIFSKCPDFKIIWKPWRICEKSKCQMSKLFDIRFQAASSNHYLYSAFIVIVEKVPVYEGRDLLPKSEARVFSWN